MWPDRRITDLFKTEFPIVLAPMAGIMEAELVIAAARLEAWYVAVGVGAGILVALLLSRAMTVGRARVTEKVGQ